MPAPYSDNMYSMVDDSDVEQDLVESRFEGTHTGLRPTNAFSQVEEQAYDDDDAYHALAPTDGYFHASNSSEAGVSRGTGISASGDHSPLGHSELPPNPLSSQVPHVPDVWVEDPSLQQSRMAAGKAKEAEQERLANSPPSVRRHPSPSFAPPPRQLPNVSIPPPQRLTGTSPPWSPAHSRASPPSTSSRATNPRYTPSSSSRFTRTHTPAGAASIYSERSSLIPSDAPPAYTPSPTSPTSSSSTASFSRSNAYRTFPNSSMGRDENRPLLHNEPEDMGGPRGGDDEYAGAGMTWRERVTKHMPAVNWINCRRGLIGLALIVLTLGFLDACVNSGRDPTNPSNPGPQAPKPPPDSPDRYPGYDDGHLDFSLGQCKGEMHKYPVQNYPINFSADRNLFIFQEVEKQHHDGRSIQITGDVVFRQQQPNGPSGIVLQMISNSEEIHPGILFNDAMQTLSITTPQAIPWSGSDSSPCLTIRITVWVPDNAVIGLVEVGVVQLGIKLLDNLHLDVVNSVLLNSVSGDIIAATTGDDDNGHLIHDGAPPFFALNSRIVSARTISAAIKGSWPLFDYLLLQSVSGNIKVGIDPKSVNKDKPVPAELHIKSKSGNLEVWEPIKRALAAEKPEDVIPPRDYVVDVHSISGNVKGGLAFSTNVLFHTTSGDITIDLLPVLPASIANTGTKYTNLETSSTSGTTVFRILDPLWVDLAASTSERTHPQPPGAPMLLPPLPPSSLVASASLQQRRSSSSSSSSSSSISAAHFMRALSSRHTTTSANLRLEYPGPWEGDIGASTMSGKIGCSGKDVRIVRSGGKWPGVWKELVAKKGQLEEGAGSELTVKTTSGDIAIVFPG